MPAKIKFIAIQKFTTTLNKFLKRPAKDDLVWQPNDLYKKIYLRNIFAQIEEHFPGENNLKIVDGGCGEGEIAIELAKSGHEVTGVDYHRASLDIARKSCEKQSFHVNFVCRDLLSFLRSIGDRSVDIGICIEVIYTCVEHEKIIREFSRVIRKGGLLIATFRSKFYFITTLLAQKQYDAALYVVNNKEGILRIALIPTYYNWHTMPEITKLYASNGFSLKKALPVGTFSGTGNDGMAHIANLEEITDDLTMDIIYKLESADLEDIKGAGRYILAVGEKSQYAHGCFPKSSL